MEEKTFFRLFFVLTIAGVFLATSYGRSFRAIKKGITIIDFLSSVFKCLLLLPLIIFYDNRVSPRDNPIVIQHHLY